MYCNFSHRKKKSNSWHTPLSTYCPISLHPSTAKLLESVIYTHSHQYISLYSFLTLLWSSFHPHYSTEAAFAKATNDFHVTRSSNNQVSVLILLDLTQEQLTQLITFFSLKRFLHLVPRIQSSPGFPPTSLDIPSQPPLLISPHLPHL